MKWKYVKRAGALLLASSLLIACGKTTVEPEPEEPVVEEPVEEPEEVEEEEPVVLLDHPEIEVTAVEQYVMSDISYSVTYPEISVNESVVEQYGVLATTLEKHNEENRQAADEAVTDIEENIEALKAGGNSSYTYLFYQKDAKVIRADNKVFSICENLSYDYAGAHGYEGNYGANFDTESGEQLRLKDLVTDHDLFIEAVEEKLSDSYSEYYDDLTSLAEVEATFADSENWDYNWTIDSEGINLYFNPYDIGVFAMGSQFVRLNFAECADFIDNSYFETPDEYVIPIDEEVQYRLSKIENDGDEALDLTLTKEAASEDAYFETDNAVEEDSEDVELYDGSFLYSVNVGESTISLDDLTGYETDSYLVYQNNTYYLYFVANMYGSNATAVVNLNDLTYAMLDGDCEINRSFTSYMEDEDGKFHTWVTSSTFITPTSFYMDARFDVLSTFQANRLYHAGSDGIPVADQDAYEVDNPYVLHALQDVPCDEVSVDGEAVLQEEQVIPTDSYVILRKTDGATYMDVQIVDPDNITQEEDVEGFYEIIDNVWPADDESLYRIYIETEDWQHLIDGTDESEYFDGIRYAG